MYCAFYKLELQATLRSYLSALQMFVGVCVCVNLNLILFFYRIYFT
jgi:hypothetical protein